MAASNRSNFNNVPKIQRNVSPPILLQPKSQSTAVVNRGQLNIGHPEQSPPTSCSSSGNGNNEDDIEFIKKKLH